MKRVLGTIALAVLALGAARPANAELIHQWKFNGLPTDSVGSAHGALGGGATITGDRLFLDGLDDQMLTGPIDQTVTQKTLISWVSLENLGQPVGGSAISLQIGNGNGAGGFDGIVYAERAAGQWMNGSNGWARTVPNNGGVAETVTEPGEVMMAITYGADNSINIYRDGALYASAATASQGVLNTYLGGQANVIFGRRHDGAGNPLHGYINEARIYDSVLSGAEILDIYLTGTDSTPSDPPPPPPPPALVHQWTFEDGTANDSVGTAHGTLNGGAQIVGGRLALDGINGYMQSSPIGQTITAKTLVSWVSLDNLSQQSGSALTLENPTGADIFDAIVFGKATAGQWMNGSNNFLRTIGNNNGPAESVTEPGEVMMAIVYGLDNSITLYRDGELYATASQGSLQTYPSGVADVLIGLRHIDINAAMGTPEGNDQFLAGFVNEARIYSGALSAAEIQSIYQAGAVPEPSTYALIALGAAGMGWQVRRRRKV
jgi:hypothetical protein